MGAPIELAQAQSEVCRPKKECPSGGYALAELDMQMEVGEAGLAPFALELANRRERREARAREQRLQEARDARKAAALLKASAGPSPAELQVGQPVHTHF